MAIEVKPISATIDSNLGNLADALDLVLVERDTASPLTPIAEAWRALDVGDLIQVRLGLNGVGYDDYGIFRVDEAALEPSESQTRQRVHARDKAALLIDERGPEFFGFRPYGRGAEPAEASYPDAMHIAGEIAARVDLGLIWEAPNYHLKGFALNGDESATSALGRLLEPLQQTKRYRADVWVDGEHLVVRRRGRGANAGTIDCSLGQATVSRARQPRVGDIDVYGETYTYLTVYDSTRKDLTSGIPEEGGDPKAEVTIEEQSPTHRKTKTWTEVDGVKSQVSETTEDLTYRDVTDEDGRWLGRLLSKSVIEEETNLEAEYPKRVITTTAYGYDDKWRLVLKDEEKWQRANTGDPSIFVSHTITSYQQITPTDVRTATQKVSKDGKAFSTDYQQAPGSLQSSIHQQQSLAETQWQTNPDGTQPEKAKGREYTTQYHGHRDGAGRLPRVYRNENLRPWLIDICQQIADDLAAESGKWLYVVQLQWPRPFSYRKGQKVTLTNVPGGCPDLIDAVIVGLHTTFDREQAVWMHDVQFEAWRDT